MAKVSWRVAPSSADSSSARRVLGEERPAGPAGKLRAAKLDLKGKLDLRAAKLDLEDLRAAKLDLEDLRRCSAAAGSVRSAEADPCAL